MGQGRGEAFTPSSRNYLAQEWSFCILLQKLSLNKNIEILQTLQVSGYATAKFYLLSSQKA
jgi:hypothetical protein